MIVKVGTRVLTSPDGTLSQERIAHLAQEIHEVLDSGRKLVLVSSGAVGAGMGQLGLGDL
jgi:glutamate 5-kinase